MSEASHIQDPKRSDGLRDGIAQEWAAASAENEAGHHHHGRRLLELAGRRSLGAEDHAEVAEVAVAHREENHEHDEVRVAVEDYGQVPLSRRHVAVHEQRDEDDPWEGGDEHDGPADGATAGHLDPTGQAPTRQIADVEEQEAADRHVEVGCPPGVENL